jgi:RimJ/RimL family protein N-acetyltransferase
VIRRIEIDDAESIAPLARSARTGAIPSLPDLHTPAEDLAFYRSQIESASGLVWVDEQDVVRGFVMWRDDLIEHLYVDTTCQRAGIGSRLLERAIAAMDLPEVRLWTFQENARAVAFYTKHGFRVIEQTDGWGNEEGLPDLLLGHPRVAAARVILLEAERLVLRQFTWADVENLVELDSDPEVTLYITGGLPTSRAEVEDTVLPNWLAYYERPAIAGFWAAEDRASREFLGWFHLRPDDGQPADEPELGYRLRRTAWGRGLATEGSRALIDLAFTSSGASRVVARTMAVHGASRRVMEKAGMTLVREFRADWPYPIPGDEFGDVEYALDRADWAARIRP